MNENSEGKRYGCDPGEKRSTSCGLEHSPEGRHDRRRDRFGSRCGRPPRPSAQSRELLQGMASEGRTRIGFKEMRRRALEGRQSMDVGAMWRGMAHRL